ncbi:MAG: single-stranded-DNA-specific exonuclease RecJ [Heliobacteriaceae bacterium]|jgi:single-stranded-DNA-specific exonuclease|nr:single-stranded-DNA-specific exonuclease RecJ [Heliobacteriaceae bacterium]
MKKEWRYQKYEGTEKSFIKKLLAMRGINTEAEIKEFLNPLEMKLLHPNVFTDMEKSAERIVRAIDNKEKIVIHGDFDADGITATALLYRTFKFLDADVNYFIPDREKEGHGFDTAALVKLMTSLKPKVIISVDCGISDVEAVDFLNSFKIDVIITDHHEAPEVLPKAFGIINPKAQNALDEKLTAKEITNMTALAGVGVAFKLAQVLLEKYNKTEFIYEILPYAAVGTIADIVPLIGENRYIVTKGLQLIPKHYGLKRLLENAGYKAENGITSENIAFGVAPRINACGRLDTVEEALKVLISDNKQEIEMAVQSLNEFNKIRQTLGQEMFLEAEAMLEKEGNKNSAIILFNPKWHIGIVGITASKLTEKYYKPVFLMTYSEETKQVRCSARSVEGINLYDVINVNSELLDGFGGHSMAAGLAFSTEKISFEEVKKNLNNTIKEVTAGQEIKPFVNIDLDLNADEINMDLVEEISKLEPFGAANPSPVFSLKNLKIKEKRLMGENKDHLRLTCQADGQEFSCIRWQHGDIALVAGDILDIAFHPQINEYNGNTSVQLIINDIHSEHLKEDEQISVKYYDHRKKTGILPLVEDYVKNSAQNIMVFAESKAVTDALKPFKTLSDKTFNRDNLRSCDAVMFFDYPGDRETFERIIELTNPSAIHFMNYEPKYLDEKAFLKTVSGMLKFASGSSGGQVGLRRCASFLGKSYEVFNILFGIFEEIGLIKILEKTPEHYRISFTDGVDLSKALHSEKYSVLMDLVDECEQFQKSLMEDDLDMIISK